MTAKRGGLRLTDQQLAGIQAKTSKSLAPRTGSKRAAHSTAAPSGVERWQALGRLKDGELNKTEQEFAALLEQWKQVGTVLWWKAHPFNIPLAKNTFYRLDFLVLHSDGLLTMYEVKGGYTSEKGQMKIKLAAEALPVMRMVKASKRAQKDGGGFKLEEF